MMDNGIFARNTSFFFLFNDVPFALAVFVQLAATASTIDRSREI